MLRCSHDELVQRWAQTYVDDGFEVTASGAEEIAQAPEVNGVQPDIVATREGLTVLVRILDSPESLVDADVRRAVQKLFAVCDENQVLHLIVAAECMLDISHKLSEWNVEPHVVHVT